MILVFGTLSSLYLRIINSVVVVGFYYGFISTFFSIGLSYLFLLQAHITATQEGEKESEEEVSAATGFLVGRFLIFVSIFDTSMHLALGELYLITSLVLFLLSFLYDTYSYENLSQPTGQILFLINLLFQLWNYFFLPSSMLARLANIYTFYYYNKMSFVTSSFVGWLIGHILLIKWVRFLLVWLQQNYFVRLEVYIFSNEYLLDTFRFFQKVMFDFHKVIFDLRMSVHKFCNILILFLIMSVQRFCSILILFICLCALERMPLPRFNFQIPRLTFQIQAGTQEEKAVEPNPQEAEEKKRIGKFIMDINKIGPSHAVFRVDTTSKIRALCEKADLLENYEAMLKVFSDRNQNRLSRAVLIEKCIPALKEKAESLQNCKNPGVHYFLSVFRNQSIVSQFLGEFDKYRKKIVKQIPRWPYRLVYKTEEGKQKKPERNIDCHLSFRKIKRLSIPKNIESPLTKGIISRIDDDNSYKLEEK